MNIHRITQAIVKKSSSIGTGVKDLHSKSTKILDNTHKT